MIVNKIKNLSTTGKIYLINSSLAFIVLFSISLMFFVQFKVESLQDKMAKIDSKIVSLDDEIRVLEVEWVYLTRPQRLRVLSKRYLQNNDYISSNQVKDTEGLKEYYLVNLRKQQNLAMNEVDKKLD
ncbi:MAG: hypothetical protein K0R25_513 [Rickettsiaceae bacterium]|jgi:hypothetical protein|nr:hypothetical protein [Rickettsiaceae bacterium]